MTPTNVPTKEDKVKMLKMCLNWKVLAGLAAAGVGIYFIAPDLVSAAIPILLLAACPLSMLLMMKGMQDGQGENAEQQAPGATAAMSRDDRLARLRAQQADLAGQIDALGQDGPQAAKNDREG